MCHIEATFTFWHWEYCCYNLHCLVEQACKCDHIQDYFDWEPCPSHCLASWVRCAKENHIFFWIVHLPCFAVGRFAGSGSMLSPVHCFWDRPLLQDTGTDVGCKLEIVKLRVWDYKIYIEIVRYKLSSLLLGVKQLSGINDLWDVLGNFVWCFQMHLCLDFHEARIVISCASGSVKQISFSLCCTTWQDKTYKLSVSLLCLPSRGWIASVLLSFDAHSRNMARHKFVGLFGNAQAQGVNTVATGLIPKNYKLSCAYDLFTLLFKSVNT